MFAQIVIVMTILRLDSNSKAVAWLQGTFWFRACSVCENSAPLGSTSSGPNVCLQGKWDLFLCAYCLLSPELFFIILPDYKAWNKKFSFSFSIVWFVSSYLWFSCQPTSPAVPRAHKGLYPILLLFNSWTAHVVKFYGKYLPRKTPGTLDSYWPPSWPCGQIAEGGNPRGSLRDINTPNGCKGGYSLFLWSCVSAVVA